MQYLKGTETLVACYYGGEMWLRGYIDVDWEGDFEEWKFISRYIQTMNREVVF